MITLSHALSQMERGELHAIDLAQRALDALDAHTDLNALITRLPTDAILTEARRVDQKRSKGEPVGALAGIPIVIKDNICQRGVPVTAASRMLRGFVSPYESTATARLREQGALPIATANLDEFAMGSTSEHSAFGPVRHPIDPARVPGGSSGGSAAAVAAGMAPAALGSDTGGSVRQPAAYCGVVGLKPTYGRVSRYGLIAFASSLDQIGPIARSVEDVTRLLHAMAGHDPLDMTSATEPVPDWLSELGKSLAGLRVGLPIEYTDQSSEPIDPAITRALERAASRLRDQGAVLTPVSLPHTQYAVATYYLIATAEASSNLARYDGVRYGHRTERPDLGIDEMIMASRSEGFGDEVKRRILLGTFVLSAGYYDAYYGRAQRVRTLICQDFDRAFDEVDVLLSPTTPSPPFELGADRSPLDLYREDVFTVAANLAGLPAISLPVACTEEGLPIGAQLMARPFDEATLLRAAHALEAGTRDDDLTL